MCGICGVYHYRNRQDVDPAVIERMNAVQAYRGPDDHGTHVAGPIGLGNRRLAIIDRAHGRQPMANADGTAWITYNGELFNYRELRRELEQAGRRFRTQSDTEVVLQAYEAYGERCVERFNGQFAFGIWDEPRSQLFLARDHLGIAPLHYADQNGTFVFASEAKGVLAHSDGTARLDQTAVAEAMLCGTLFAGRTMFAGVRSLEPGHTLTVSPAGLRLQPYWQMPPTDAEANRSEAEYRDQLLPLLRDALQVRLVSEVPWGVLLSGGTDSSTLAVLASQLVSEPLATFTIDYPNKWKGKNVDAEYARLMAGRLQTRHHEFLVDPADYWDTLRTVVRHVERPFNKGAATMYLLYRQIKEHATVVITGEGADELFAGYVGERGFGLDAILAEGKIAQFPWTAPWPSICALFSADFQRTVRPAEVFHACLEGALAQAPDSDLLNQALHLYTRYFLLELLEIHDRTSLASGVEVRLPFLDRRFVELLSAMPSRFKARNGQTKYLFKQAIQDLLPAEIIGRKKTPLPIPRDPKTLGAQVRMARELLGAPDARSAGCFDLGKVHAFLDQRDEFQHLDALAVWQVSMYLVTMELLFREFRL